MIKKIYISFISLFALIFLSNCAHHNPDEGSSMFDSIINQHKVADIPIEVINKMLKSLPSPVEMTTIIKETGAEFQEKNINKASNYKNYTTSYKKALNLGVYGTNLGYINMFDKFFMAIDYLDVVRTLSDDLNVGQFFDYKTIEQMVSNKSNIDSLMRISTVSFERMTMHLKDQNRSHISALILIGGWIEGLYIYTQTYKFKPIKDLADRICEQKIALNDLMILVSVYENDSSFKELNNELKQLKNAFDKVQITYIVGEPLVDVIDGMLVIQEQTESVIECSDEDLNNIIRLTEKIRNGIISSSN